RREDAGQVRATSSGVTTTPCSCDWSALGRVPRITGDGLRDPDGSSQGGGRLSYRAYSSRPTTQRGAIWARRPRPLIRGTRPSVVGMGAHEVSRFGHVELADMPDDLRERIGAIAEKSGFVPNVFRALARRPRELRAFLDYHDALMDSNDGLSKAERELVVVATSGANHCTYCVVAHGAILRVRTKDPEIADRVATNPYGVELSQRERA